MRDADIRYTIEDMESDGWVLVALSDMHTRFGEPDPTYGSFNHPVLFRDPEAATRTRDARVGENNERFKVIPVTIRFGDKKEGKET
jgi:hypothetical protein